MIQGLSQQASKKATEDMTEEGSVFQLKKLAQRGTVKLVPMESTTTTPRTDFSKNS